jgi:hypothetical protein
VSAFHFTPMVFVRSGTDVGLLGLARYRPSISSQWYFDGVAVRPLRRPVKFFHTDLDKPFLYGPCLVRGGIVMKQEKAFPKTVATKLEA